MAKSTRSRNKDAGRRTRKRVSPIVTEGVTYIDWKDVNLLRKFMSERSKIRARRVTGNNAQQQRAVARAIKNAREMALLPYVTRVTQQRRSDRSRSERPERSEPSPTPSTPPPGTPDTGDGED